MQAEEKEEEAQKRKPFALHCTYGLSVRPVPQSQPQRARNVRTIAHTTNSHTLAITPAFIQHMSPKTRKIHD